MEVYIGAIMQFPYQFNRVLLGWEHCNGQVLPVKNHEALFSLIGFQFGGDGRDHFAVPDLRPKDEHGNPIHLNTGDVYNSKPYIPYYIATEGLYPQFD
jgi:microcystin-dependent protein